MPWCPDCGAEYRQGFTQCSECQVDLVDSLDEESPPIAPSPEWVGIATFTSDEEARLARGYLAEAGVPAELIDRHMHVALLAVGELGNVVLAVPPGREDQARDLLARADRGLAALDETADGDGETVDR